jgi:hypothetical protein
MNLTFKVLWFDDTAEFFHSLDLDPFVEQIRSWGFESSFDLVSTPDEFMKKEPFKDYDLIVVDYNLGDNQPHGETFIKRIRDHQVYTELIFYSAQPSPNLWAAISQAQLEGVYVANRQVILDKLLSVAHQSVHKILDLNNMRGMVMAEVGDIDGIIDSILTFGIPALEGPEQSAIFGRFHDESLKQVEENREKLTAFNANRGVGGMIELCDSNKRWANFNRLKKKHPLIKAVAIGDYVADVLRPRNYLAHGTPTTTEAGQVFRWRDGEYLFTEAESQSLRKMILEYRRKFKEIQDTLAPAAAA